MMLLIWNTPLWAAASFYLLFTTIEMAYLSATLLKVPAGGWCGPVLLSSFVQACTAASSACFLLCRLASKQTAVGCANLSQLGSPVARAVLPRQHSRVCRVPNKRTAVCRFPIVVALVFSSLMFCWHWVRAQHIII